MKNLLYSSPATFGAAVAVLGLAVAAPAAAQDRIGVNRYAVTLQPVDRHPATPEAARRTLARIGKAALAVCGASPFSLREVTWSVRHSACWRDSVADAVTRIDDPLLTAAYSNTH
ncbi:UrcA family protein [Novosphingobium naphthalenivorans]|uniref:UrcA family protein n=1 Tax=Novosphingobium naphthalenivorans TaxID=273168 RepID=UPI00083528C8|nr:UrcA family protein [Novosphingobium naphthalenivorans]